jgi:hypothetical protein
MRLVSKGVVATAAIAAVGFAGLVATWAIEDMRSVADTGQEPARPYTARGEQPRADPPVAAPPTPFPSDASGFIDSSARCPERQPASAIGRTPGSLVVICAERTGRYEYLGVRLSDAAMLRTNARSDSARSYLAQKAGVLYEVSPTELRVTAGGRVIKAEPMIFYREAHR